MSQKYPASWNNCATCSYWLGERNVDSFVQNVEVSSSSERGKCLCKRSGWFRTEKQASMSCQSYDKWQPLKQ